METNSNIKNGRWLEIRGEVRKAWGKLTDDELNKTEGSMKAIAGLIQQRYGEAQDKIQERLSTIFKKFEGKTPDKSENHYPSAAHEGGM